MTRVRSAAVTVSLVAVVTLIGCKSKQDAPEKNSVALQQNAGDVKYVSGQNASGSVETKPQDKADAEAAATHVISQFLAGEFSAIYNEATSGFKAIGSEAQFVAKYQQTRQETGLLGNPKETSFATRPDNAHVLVYRLENERIISDVRLTFEGSKNGKMTLAGLNQHSEPKKK